MLKNKEIIVFSDELARHPFSCQHIMKHFFADNDVVWVTPTGMRNPRFSLYDMKRVMEKTKKWFFQDKPVHKTAGNGALQIAPFAVPYNDIAVIRRINNSIVVRNIRKRLRTGKDRIVLTTLPIAAEYVDSFDAAVIVYYIVDDFTEWPGCNRKYISELEETLIRKSDLLVASAERLCEKKTRNTRPLLIPHGVDYEHFAERSEACHDYHDMKRPIIGFFGAVSPWLDFGLLKYAATARRDWTFLFIGPVDAEIGELAGLENVHFHGRVSYDDLPRYAGQFDVGIIPFLINELTVSVNPLKLLEYFACGLPVVSTALPEVMRYSEHVLFARSPEEFVAQLDRAISSRTCGKEERMSVAAKQSWQTRAAELSRLIEEKLGSLDR